MDLCFLKDIGHSEVGAEDYSSSLEYNGHAAQGIGVLQLSNANALDVDAAAKAELKELSKSFPPGLQYAVAFDSTTVIGDSIHRRFWLHSLKRLSSSFWSSSPFPARLARHLHHPSRHHSRFADRHLRLYPHLQFLHQLTHPLWHHSGYRPGRRRCHRGH